MLASGEDVNRWSPLTAPVAPLLPREPDSMGLGAADRYAWAAFAGELAARGCFGFDITIAAEALAARPRLERALNPADVAAGEQAAFVYFGDVSDDLKTRTGFATGAAIHIRIRSAYANRNSNARP